MKKDDNNWMIWAGLAVGAWFLFKDKLIPPTNAVTTNLQTSVSPANALQQLTNTVIKAINPVSKAIPVSTSPNIIPASQQTATVNPVQKAVDNTVKPIPANSQPLLTPPAGFDSGLSQNATVVNDAAYMMFKNGDYPGGTGTKGILMGSCTKEYAAAIGEY